jgi:hypothetical protein
MECHKETSCPYQREITVFEVTKREEEIISFSVLVPVKGDHPMLITVDLIHNTITTEGYD